MKSNYKRLEPYIEFIDSRAMGHHSILDLDSIRGISSISKDFIKTRANLVGVVADKYKVVESCVFAYNPNTARMGDKIPIALNQFDSPVLVSSIYPTFKIKDINYLHPEYLMMWFRRPEFDRYARFMSHGSAREVFDIDEMNGIRLPIPSITKQKEIVKEYNVIQNRITLNQQLIQKLEETAQTIYKQWFVEGIDLENLPDGWRVGFLNELCEYSSKRISIIELGVDNYISTENMLQNKAGVVLANGLPATGGVINFEDGDILISNIRPYFKKIWLATFSGGCSNDVLCFVPKTEIPSLYLYQILEKDNFFEHVMAGSKGTKMPRGDKKWIMNYETIIPSSELLEEFSKTTNFLQKNIQLKKTENQKLMEMKDLLLSKLATIDN